MIGVEASIGVEDIHATIAAAEAAGGKIIMPPYRIEGVGELFYFEDTEGNLLGAMQYDAGVFAASCVMLVITEGAAWSIRPARAIWIPAGHKHRIAFAVKSLCERSIIVYSE